MTLLDLEKFLFERFPKNLQCDWDNCGIQTGRISRDCSRLLIALDIDEGVADEARRLGCGLILTHHPLIFDPPRKVTDRDTPLLLKLIQNDTGVISMHTNLDAAGGGAADCLAGRLKLADPRPFASDGTDARYGRLGGIEPTGPAGLIAFVKGALGAPHVRAYCADRTCARIAAVPGAGGRYLSQAAEEGADALICGDCKYHDFRLAAALGLSLIDPGHFYTERPVLEMLKSLVLSCFERISVFISEQPDACRLF